MWGLTRYNDTHKRGSIHGPTLPLEIFYLGESRAMYAVLLIWIFIFLWLGFYLWHKLLYHLMAGIFTALCLIICTFSYIIVRQHQLQIQVRQRAVEKFKYRK